MVSQSLKRKRMASPEVSAPHQLLQIGLFGGSNGSSPFTPSFTDFSNSIPFTSEEIAKALTADFGPTPHRRSHSFASSSKRTNTGRKERRSTSDYPGDFLMPPSFHGDEQQRSFFDSPGEGGSSQFQRILPSRRQESPEEYSSAMDTSGAEFGGFPPLQPSTSHSSFQEAGDPGSQSQSGRPSRRDTLGVEFASAETLSDEQKMLLELRDNQNMPWKDIAAKFEAELGRSDRVPALQMRYKRLKERLRVWTETDVEALRRAHAYWETKKFEIISEKMLEYGCAEKWPARYCQQKWRELNPGLEQSMYYQNQLVASPQDVSGTMSMGYGQYGYGQGQYPQHPPPQPTPSPGGHHPGLHSPVTMPQHSYSVQSYTDASGNLVPYPSTTVAPGAYHSGSRSPSGF